MKDKKKVNISVNNNLSSRAKSRDLFSQLSAVGGFHILTSESLCSLWQTKKRKTNPFSKPLKSR